MANQGKFLREVCGKYEFGKDINQVNRVFQIGTWVQLAEKYGSKTEILRSLFEKLPDICWWFSVVLSF